MHYQPEEFETNDDVEILKTLNGGIIGSILPIITSIKNYNILLQPTPDIGTISKLFNTSFTAA
jgi:hypothetical protein